MTNNIIKHWKKIIIIALAVKFAFLAWAVHPFDFWTFVNTIQRHTLYDWNLFEYWNKGNLLLILWYPLYALYLKILSLGGIGPDNLLLLHFVFKIPFILVDLLIGYLIQQTVLAITKDKKLGILSLILWFVNPIPYYVYGLHGHYELIMPLALTLLIYGTVKRSPLSLTIGFVIGFTTKYFIILFLPFILIKLLLEKSYKIVWQSATFSLLGIVASYLHLLFFPEQFQQLLNSIFELSGSNAPLGSEIIRLAPLNIIAAFYGLISPNEPITNVSQPTIFWLANQGLKITAFILVAHVGWRISSVRKTRTYTLETFICDCLILLVYFLILLTNFQAHYFSWLLPLLMILIGAYRHYLLKLHLLIITIAGFIFAYKNEIGIKTFFLDLFTGFSPSDLGRVDDMILYRTGAVIIVVLLMLLFYLVFRHRFQRNGEEGVNLTSYWISVGLLWLLITIPMLQASWAYIVSNKQQYLAYQRSGGIHRGAIFETFSVKLARENSLSFYDSDHNSLTLYELTKLSSASLDDFHISVLIPSGEESNDFVDKLSALKFNDCDIKPVVEDIYNLEKRLYYSGFNIPLSCISDTNNTLYLPNNLKLSEDKLSNWKLYVQNRPVEYLYATDNTKEINILAVVGIVYIVVGIYSGWLLVRKLEHDG